MHDPQAKGRTFSDHDPLVTVKDLARYLGITPQTLKASPYLRANLPEIKLGHRYYYQWSDVQKLINASRKIG